MYEMGDYFKFDLSKSVSNPECTFKGAKYRITVLTERLIRLEYNDSGLFVDYPSSLVWFRNFPKPEFTFQDNNGVLKIRTKYFELIYVKEKSFDGGKLTPTKNLKVTLLNADKNWYYGHPEIRNFNYASYKDRKGKIVYEKGMYSQDGFVSIDDSDTPLVLQNGTFRKREGTGLDIYLFMYNKDFYYCLNDYFKITGFPPLIPRYAFGSWWCKDTHYSEYDIAKIARKFSEHNIPLSLIILKNWESNKRYELDENYKEMTNIINFLNQKNMRLGFSLNDISKFDKNTKNYELLSKYLQPNEKGIIPFNVYNSRDVDALLKLLIHPIDAYGVDFYSLDFESNENVLSKALLRHYLYRDNIRDKNNRPILSSSNFKYGAHRYSVIYSGESEVGWDDLKNITKFNSSSSNMGLSYWTHDFGGTKGGVEDGELFTRYIQLGTFSNILRLGSGDGKYYKREPWKWDIETEKITSDFLRLRYKLIPYIYTESYKYYKYGKPMIEPIYYRYPILYDDTLYNNNYFFGSSFYISPIVTKKEPIMDRVIHKLYIPHGTWYDYFTGKKYAGNKKYVSFYKQEEYPVFVKSGAIIPISNNDFNDVSVPKELEIQVFPGDNNTYSIYEDDGVSNEYLNGVYAITNIEYRYKKDNYTLTILPVEGKTSILPKERDYKIRFKNTKPSAIVQSFVNGNRIDNKRNKEGNDLVIEVFGIPTNAQVTFICKGDNIEIEDLRIINSDFVSIISDLPIKTTLKHKVDNIMFNKELPIKKKRIEIRKLAHGREYLEKKYVDLFLKLLEYINEV